MEKKIKRFESTMWLCVKLILYAVIMATFILMMAKENPTVIRLSRTMGITMTTYCIVGLLFLSIYGKYDVGRRKSKPIIYSLALAVGFTDVVTYLQLMIMNTITPSVSAFRLDSVGLLCLTYIVQVIIIILATYGGNALFFKIHDPESCCIVTSSQENLDAIVRAILKYKKQYRIDYIVDYRDKNVLDTVGKADAVFIYGVPSPKRSEIIRFCYKERLNVYLNPEIEDIMEINAQYYLLDDVSVINKNVKAWTMEQRIMKKLMDMGLAVVFVIILFILAEVWKKDDDEEDEENEDTQEDESEEEQEEEPAVMSRREKKKARKADKKKQKQEEKAAVAEAKARAKRERQEAKLAKKNKKAHVDESEQEPEVIPAEPMEETQAAGSTQEIVLPQELMQEAQSTGNTQEIVLPTEEAQEKQESTDETEDPDKTLLEETASLFAADIASMMGENQTNDTEEPEKTDASDSTEQTQTIVLEEVSEEKQETGDKKLAMPVYTKEELLEKAEADGDEPEVIEDEVSGVTLVDYSDVL